MAVSVINVKTRPEYIFFVLYGCFTAFVFIRFESGIAVLLSIENMRLWVKHARQVVRIVSDSDACREYLAGTAQKDCKLAILEEENGVGLSVIIDQWDHFITF